MGVRLIYLAARINEILQMGNSIWNSNGILKSNGSGTIATQGVDASPTEDSANLVQSGGVFAEEALKADKVVDATAGNVAELDENGNLVDSDIPADNVAQQDGNYKEMTVGNAEQLNSTVFVTEEDPYNFRPSGGSADIGNREYLDSIEGVSLAWNQLVQSPDFSSLSKWYQSGISATVSNRVASFTTDAQYDCLAQYNRFANAGHVYFISATVGTSDTTNSCPIAYYVSGSGWKYITYKGTTAQNYATIDKGIATDSQFRLGIGLNSTSVNVTVKEPCVIDLTQMFGSTIADYIYSLEQATAGAGVAFFRTLFPKPYYAYDAGSIQSVKALSHDMTGFNQWDGTYSSGYINKDTGAIVETSDIAHTDYIPCIAGQTYYFHHVVNGARSAGVAFYDASKNFIVGYETNEGFTRTAPSNAYYIRTSILLNTARTAPYYDDICINLSWSGYRNGEYEPYEKHTYALGDVELRGIPKLDADNNLYYDGDVYFSDGTVVRKYGIVDLGTLNWYQGPNFFDTDVLTDLRSDSDWVNSICSKYQFYDAGTLDANPTLGVCYSGSKKIRLYGSSFADAAACKAGVSGVYVVYPLTTETIESTDPYTEVQYVNDFGTEEFVDRGVSGSTRDVAIPVGNITKYPANLRDKLQHLPDLADDDGEYLIEQDGTQMSLVAANVLKKSGGTMSGAINMGSNKITNLAKGTSDADAINLKQFKEDTDLDKYDGLLNVINITSATTTMGDIVTQLASVNTNGDHVVFDVSALNAGMYLCTIYLGSGYYRICDLVTGFEGTGFFSNSDLLVDIINSGATSTGKHYTFVWDKVNAKGTRLNDAASITTTTTNFGHFGSVNQNYDNPFDSIYPWSGRKLCNIDLDEYMALTASDDITDCVVAWEDDVAFDYDHQYGVWVYTPAFFGRTYEIGNYRYFDVTDENLQNNIAYKPSISGRWHGCDVTLTIDGTSKHCNLPKTGMPMANVALSTQHTYAKNYKASLVDIYTLDASLLLYLVEYADFNSQIAIGDGVSDMYQQGMRPSADVTNNNVITLTSANAKCIVGAIIDIGTSDGGNNVARTYITAVNGATLTLADNVTVTTSHYVSVHGLINVADADIGSKTGYIGTNGRSNVYYRGEVLYGNKWQYILGCYRQQTSNKIYVAEEDDTDNYDALNTTKHIDSGCTIPTVASANWYYYNGLGVCPLFTSAPFISSVGGNTSNPIGDGVYIPLPSAGNTVLVVGGGANDGAYAGAWCVSWYFAASASNWSFGSRPHLKNPS